MTDTTGITILGLADFEGETVTAFVAGLDCGEGVVLNGQLFISYGSDPDGFLTYHYLSQVTAMIRNSGYTIAPDLTLPIDGGHFEVPVVIGYRYSSRGQRLRPFEPGESGAQMGPAFGKLKRVNRAAFMLSNSWGVKVGTDFDHLHALQLRTPGHGTNLSPTELFTGIAVDPISDDDTYDGMLCWEVDGPYPCTVTMAGDFLETEDV
jgi:hypothetical protein